MLLLLKKKNSIMYALQRTGKNRPFIVPIHGRPEINRI